MRSLGKFVERQVGCCFGSGTQQREDHPEHELELDGKALPDSRSLGHIASGDSLKILRLSPSDAANHIRWRIDAKRILLVIDRVLLHDGQAVHRYAASQDLR